MKTKTLSLSVSQFIVLFSISSLVGCLGDGSEATPDLSEVTGVVTLDGKPLQGANVIFEPEEVREKGRRRASSANTDAEGKYKLMYNKNASGATLGKHKVVILKMSDNPSEAGNQLVPAQYNEETTLTAEVKEGENVKNFDLKSK